MAQFRLTNNFFSVSAWRNFELHGQGNTSNTFWKMCRPSKITFDFKMHTKPLQNSDEPRTTTQFTYECTLWPSCCCFSVKLSMLIPAPLQLNSFQDHVVFRHFRHMHEGFRPVFNGQFKESGVWFNLNSTEHSPRLFFDISNFWSFLPYVGPRQVNTHNCTMHEQEHTH